MTVRGGEEEGKGTSSPKQSESFSSISPRSERDTEPKGPEFYDLSFWPEKGGKVTSWLEESLKRDV